MPPPKHRGALAPEVVEVLGVHFHNLTRREAAAAIGHLAQAEERSYVVKPYSEFMPRAAHDPGLRDILNGADLCLADGVGILWAAHYLSLPGGTFRALLQLPLSLCAMVLKPAALRAPLKEAMSGVDLTWQMLARLDDLGAGVFLLGGTEREVSGARALIEKRFPKLRIAGLRDGYFETQGRANEEVITEINGARPQALLVAMGFPRQESWIAANIDRLTVGVAVAEGGSFSFICGAARRAPGWMRRTGLEWLFRLLRQPWRVRRQLAIPLFLWLVLRERLRRGGRRRST